LNGASILCRRAKDAPAGWRRMGQTVTGYTIFERLRTKAAAQAQKADTQSERIENLLPAPVLEMASDIQEVPISWCWPNRLEYGALCLLGADPGVGKSLLLATLAAHVTTGRPWPDRHGNTRGVLIVSSEDDPRKSTRPRLRVAEADLNRVGILRQVRIADGDGWIHRQLCLQSDLSAMRQAMSEIGDVGLVCVDPIDSYIGRDTRSNANEEVRAVLEPLVQLAEETGACIVIVKHLNKADMGGNALYRISGSMAFVALSRCVHIIGHDPEDKSRKLLMPLKISHGVKPGGLAYTVEQTAEGLPLLAWDAAPVDADPDAVLSRKPTKAPTAKNRASEWLEAQLAAGPVLSRLIEDGAKAAGFSLATLNRAKEALGVQSSQVRDGAKIVSWELRLPEVAVCS
jgi:hypothetical protein